MRCFYAVSLILFVASATKIRLSFILQPEKNLSSLTVYRDSGGLIGGICGRTFEAREPIDFSEVNDRGEGNFTVGNATYKVHHHPLLSGGPRCHTDPNPPYISIHCSRLWWNDNFTAVETMEDSCFGNFTQEEAPLQKRHQKPKLERRCRRSPNRDGSG